jgi:hypothetical protein
MTLLLLLCLTSAWAGNQRRIGTAGAQELLIPIGSRGTAMGGAVVANTYGLESVYWNPAGLASLEGTEAMFTHLPYIADIDVNFFGIATSIEGFGSLAFSSKLVDVGSIEETTEQYPDGTGRTFSPNFVVIGASYARILNANVSFGATANFVYEKIADASASGVAFDVGFIYEPRWRGLKLGLSIKNYGPEMQFTGRGFEADLNGHQAAPQGSKFDLPSSINIGVSYDLLNEGPNHALASGNFRSNNLSQDLWQGGLEYVYNENYMIRAGYNYSEQTEYMYGFSFGGGLRYPVGSTVLSFEYAWMETDVDAFDANQFFTLKASF